jgi:hypothetical protein
MSVAALALSAICCSCAAAAAAANKELPEELVACEEDTEFMRPELMVDFSACVADIVRR